MDGTVISTRLIGAYNAANVLAAIAVGDYFGIPREESIAAVESFVPDNERSEMRRTQKNALIVDAYNANPTSMAAVLDNFERMLGGGEGRPGLALLGEMRELGADSLREHAGLLRRLLASEDIPCVILVGQEFLKALDECGLEYEVVDEEGKVAAKNSRSGEGNSPFVWAPTSETLLKYLRAHSVEGRLVLIKGSRSTQMEKVIPAL